MLGHRTLEASMNKYLYVIMRGLGGQCRGPVQPNKLKRIFTLNVLHVMVLLFISELMIHIVTLVFHHNDPLLLSNTSNQNMQIRQAGCLIIELHANINNHNE